ncbi:IS3 family transposase, partial [Pseudoalteromonas aurantia]
EHSWNNLSADERTELLRLRKKNKELRMLKEILKKACALLLKETK